VRTATRGPQGSDPGRPRHEGKQDGDRHGDAVQHLVGILGRLLACLSHDRLMVSRIGHFTGRCALSWVDEWT
jgi:hypothetical protein